MFPSLRLSSEAPASQQGTSAFPVGRQRHETGKVDGVNDETAPLTRGTQLVYQRVKPIIPLQELVERWNRAGIDTPPGQRFNARVELADSILEVCPPGDETAVEVVSWLITAAGVSPDPSLSPQQVGDTTRDVGLVLTRPYPSVENAVVASKLSGLDNILLLDYLCANSPHRRVREYVVRACLPDVRGVDRQVHLLRLLSRNATLTGRERVLYATVAEQFTSPQGDGGSRGGVGLSAGEAVAAFKEPLVEVTERYFSSVSTDGFPRVLTRDGWCDNPAAVLEWVASDEFAGWVDGFVWGVDGRGDRVPFNVRVERCSRILPHPALCFQPGLPVFGSLLFDGSHTRECLVLVSEMVDDPDASVLVGRELEKEWGDDDDEDDW